jgi:hypothetical protein
LTTIFTPPKSCFSPLPTSWGKCTSNNLLSDGLFCDWHVPTTCYPPKASVYTINYEGSTANTWYYMYSPGVLPSGFETGNYNSQGATTQVMGCPT